MELKRGIIKAFDAAQYTATVQVAGSLSVWLSGVPVAKYLSAELLAVGARCGIAFFDEANPKDACVVFIYEGVPGEWVSDGMVVAGLSGSKVTAATTAARGTVELAQDGEVGAGLVVQGNDARLADARTPLEHGHTKHSNRTRNLFLSAKSFGASYGNPVEGTVGHTYMKTPVWLLGGGYPSVASTFWVPEDFNGGNITIKEYWSMATATSGQVRLTSSILPLASGESVMDNAASWSTRNISVPGTAQTLAISSCSLSGVAAGDMVNIRFNRATGSAQDTAEGSLQFWGLEIEYTADM